MKPLLYALLAMLLSACGCSTNKPEHIGADSTKTDHTTETITDDEDDEADEGVKIGDTITISGNEKNFYMAEIHEFPYEKFKLDKSKPVFLGYYDEEYGDNYILLKQKENSYIVINRCEFTNNDITYRCMNPFVTLNGDTLETECERQAHLFHDYYVLTKDKFEHIRWEEEDPNSEIEGAIDTARQVGDGLRYCELSYGLQYRGEELPDRLHVGLLMLKQTLDSLAKIGKQSEIDSLINIFDKNYAEGLVTEEYLEDWKKVKEMRSSRLPEKSR